MKWDADLPRAYKELCRASFKIDTAWWVAGGVRLQNTRLPLPRGPGVAGGGTKQYF